MRIWSSLRAGICPSAGLGVDELLPMSLIAAYDCGAGISAQPRKVFNPPPVCRWVQPVVQGLVLLIGIKQHDVVKVKRQDVDVCLFCVC